MNERVVICNAGDQVWQIMRSYGPYTIPAPQPGEEFALLEVTDRRDFIGLGDDNRVEVPIHAQKIAEDLVSDLAKFGVFVCAGEKPTAEELAGAKSLIVEEAKRLVFEGDQEWARSHNYRVISDLHRRAVKRLGLEREWAYEPMEMAECPVCGERVKPNVAMCKSCGAILDREKAAQFGVLADAGPARRQRSAAKSA